MIAANARSAAQEMRPCRRPCRRRRAVASPRSPTRRLQTRRLRPIGDFLDRRARLRGPEPSGRRGACLSAPSGRPARASAPPAAIRAIEDRSCRTERGSLFASCFCAAGASSSPFRASGGTRGRLRSAAGDLCARLAARAVRGGRRSAVPSAAHRRQSRARPRAAAATEGELSRMSATAPSSAVRRSRRPGRPARRGEMAPAARGGRRHCRRAAATSSSSICARGSASARSPRGSAYRATWRKSTCGSPWRAAGRRWTELSRGATFLFAPSSRRGVR